MLAARVTDTLARLAAVDALSMLFSGKNHLAVKVHGVSDVMGHTQCRWCCELESAV